MNDNKETNYQDLWDLAKAVIRGNFIGLHQEKKKKTKSAT